MCLGPLTTVALACRLDPALPSKVKELLWMGGTIRAKGNVSLTGEFNVHKVTSQTAPLWVFELNILEWDHYIGLIVSI